SWREAAVSVRIVEKHPWLMCFRKRGNLVELRDPLHWTSYTLSLPELADSTVGYARDGWLLMNKTRSKDVFFFNPFSREVITLPECELDFDKIAFSCPPTSDNCVVVAIRFPDFSATISTCHPGDDKWVTATYPSYIRAHRRSNIVYQNDRFYCFSADGTLSSFNPSSCTWSYLCAPQLNCSYINDGNNARKETAVALAEKEGELFVIFRSSNERPMVYKLLVSLEEWEEMSTSTFDGLTIFVGFCNSELRTNLPWMRNSIYFSRFGYNRKHCVSYSFDESRYNPPKEWQNWIELCPPQSLWLDPPPKNVLSSLHNN
ncbi:PREDICTED: F-box protein At4g00893-like, partial [Camelina sativa]|uniref:F-box protein At4g00893-like n=1 Tax=Camelina sativa TaxID=90675 RepID=A0ABM0Y875_CAMSA